MINDFIMRHFDFIKLKSRRLARDAVEADELIQKSQIILWEQYDRLSVLPDQSVKAFLSKSIINTLIDLRRHEKRIVSYDSLTMPPQCSDNGFENAVLDNIMVMSVIYKLSTLEQDIVFKTYFMGMDSTIIGEQLNMPPSSIRSIRMRANKKMKKLLQREE
ncbi:MAG: sigma-70 family RNA polymerase sigma factor [Oscillospiraceae bacterium]|nr:sigma-70 family RNA polymerase sigma factor [Oscillospiraceae bacterium]